MQFSYRGGSESHIGDQLFVDADFSGGALGADAEVDFIVRFAKKIVVLSFHGRVQPAVIAFSALTGGVFATETEVAASLGVTGLFALDVF